MKKYTLIASLIFALALGYFSVVKAQTTDTTLPVVAITVPVASATLSGTTTLTATATDNVGVTKVEFFDGTTSVGVSTGTSSPYSFSWNTVGVPNGVHVLTANASDAAGNIKTSAPVGVIVKNSGKDNTEGKNKMMININPSGEALIRGLVTANTGGVLTVQAWGVSFTVNTAGAKNLNGVTGVSTIAVGDFVGVLGKLDTTATSPTINARVVKLWNKYAFRHDDSSIRGNSQNHQGDDKGKGKGHDSDDN